MKAIRRKEVAFVEWLRGKNKAENCKKDSNVTALAICKETLLLSTLTLDN